MAYDEVYDDMMLLRRKLKCKDVLCAHKGWWFCKLKCALSKVDRIDEKTADSFEDWIYFDGESWDIQDYRVHGFYVFDVIKGE